MTTAVFGTYQDGQIILDEVLPVSTRKAKVLVTIVEEISDESTPEPRRQLGFMQGTFTGDYWFSEEFNEPIDDLKDYM